MYLYIYIPSICIYIYILIGVPIMGIQRALGEVRNADGPVDPWVPCLDTTDFSYSSVVSLLVASRFSLRIYHIINFVYVPTFVDKFVGLRTSYGFASFTPSFKVEIWLLWLWEVWSNADHGYPWVIFFGSPVLQIFFRSTRLEFHQGLWHLMRRAWNFTGEEGSLEVGVNLFFTQRSSHGWNPHRAWVFLFWESRIVNLCLYLLIHSLDDWGKWGPNSGKTDGEWLDNQQCIHDIVNWTTYIGIWTLLRVGKPCWKVDIKLIWLHFNEILTAQWLISIL